MSESGEAEVSPADIMVMPLDELLGSEGREGALPSLVSLIPSDDDDDDDDDRHYLERRHHHHHRYRHRTLLRRAATDDDDEEERRVLRAAAGTSLLLVRAIVRRYGPSLCRRYFSPSNRDDGDDDCEVFSEGGLGGDDAAAQTTWRRRRRRRRPIDTGDFRVRLAERDEEEEEDEEEDEARREGARPPRNDENDGEWSSHPPTRSVSLEDSISTVGAPVPPASTIGSIALEKSNECDKCDNGDRGGKKRRGRRRRILLDVEMIPPTEEEEGEGMSSENNETPMQCVGRIVHAIFSDGKGPCPVRPNIDDVEKDARDSVDEDDGAGGEGRRRRQKTKRRKGNYISNDGSSTFSFSSLLEGGDFPISVCRLISDMMVTPLEAATPRMGSSTPADEEREGGSSVDARDGVDPRNGDSDDDQDDNPFSSLDDVARDLERMVDDPRTFLYDPEGGDFCSNLRFGRQGYYGRTRELRQFLDAATAERKKKDDDNSVARVDVIFVSGAAGSGKSHFVRNATEVLLRPGEYHNDGTMVLEAKFKRGSEYESQDILSSLFERLVSNIVSMSDDKGGSRRVSGNGNDGGEDEAEYGHRAARAVRETIDPAGLASLARFVPGIWKLFRKESDGDKERPHEASPPPVIGVAGAKAAENDSNQDSNASHWRLVFLLSGLLGAVLGLGRRVVICLDDLQWCDSTTSRLITEILISVSQRQEAMTEGGGGGRKSNQLLFVGMTRDNEMNNHPFTYQLVTLKKCISIDVAEIKLSILSKEDVVDMISYQFRLPRRLVRELAKEVHQKTSGHALFVVQLLNSLVQDSTISYSPLKRRYNWNIRRISALRTNDGVASLIVSNLSLLKPRLLRCLMILSCLGMQSDLSLIRILDRESPSTLSPQGGIESFLPGLVERGVLDMPGHSSSVIFSHDLIQQHIYDSIPEEERRMLHYGIGTFLGSTTTLDSTSHKSSIEGCVDQLYLSDASSTTNSMAKPLSLVFIAADQINAAGPEFIREHAQQTRFAGWNLHTANRAAEASNFQAALYHYGNGIDYLRGGLWLGDSTYQLCKELHEGAVIASFALGDAAGVERFANAIINNVPFEDSLVAQTLLIRSMKSSGNYAETIARGLAVLRMLKIDIPSAPSPMTIMQSMCSTGKITSQYTSSQITNLKQTSINARKRNILKIADAVTVASYREASPYLPLVACAMVTYSLQNGVVEESATAFVVYGYFKVFMSEDFEEGRRWGDIALKILDSSYAFTSMTLYGFLLFWFIPHREVSSILHGTYEAGMKVGDVDNATYSLCLSLRFSFFAGEKLSILSRSYDKVLSVIAKYNPECLKFCLIDSLVVDGLRGEDNCRFAAFEGRFQDENVLLADAKYRYHNQGVEAICLRRFFSAFWKGNYKEARKWVEAASSLPSYKMPKVQLIHHTFYRGLIAFQLYREGEGENWLEEGEKVLSKMELWLNNSKVIFESKLYLIEAEHYASMCNIVAAKESYELSAKAARDHALVHEQGLAYELYGKFLLSLVEIDEAKLWFQRAHTSYMQWGAIAKAGQLQRDHNLSISPDKVLSANLGSAKHGRDEGEGLV